MPGLHHIHCIEIDLNFTHLEEKDALLVQREAVKILKEKIVPAWEEILLRFDVESEWITIGSIVLDLGQIPENNWRYSFVERCNQLFMEKIFDYFFREKNMLFQGQNPSVLAIQNENPRFFDAMPKVVKDTNALLEYLKTGIGNNNWVFDAKFNLNESVVSVLLSPYQASQLFHLLQTNNQALLRLVAQLSFHEWIQLLNQKTGLKLGFLEKLWEYFQLHYSGIESEIKFYSISFFLKENISTDFSSRLADYLHLYVATKMPEKIEINWLKEVVFDVIYRFQSQSETTIDSKNPLDKEAQKTDLITETIDLMDKGIPIFGEIIRKYLKTGYLSPYEALLQKHTLDELLIEYIHFNRNEAFLLLKEVLTNPSWTHRFVYSFSINSISSLLGVVASSFLTQEQWTEQLDDFMESMDTTNDFDKKRQLFLRLFQLIGQFQASLKEEQIYKAFNDIFKEGFYKRINPHLFMLKDEFIHYNYNNSLPWWSNHTEISTLKTGILNLRKEEMLKVLLSIYFEKRDVEFLSIFSDDEIKAVFRRIFAEDSMQQVSKWVEILLHYFTDTEAERIERSAMIIMLNAYLKAIPNEKSPVFWSEILHLISISGSISHHDLHSQTEEMFSNPQFFNYPNPEVFTLFRTHILKAPMISSITDRNLSSEKIDYQEPDAEILMGGFQLRRDVNESEISNNWNEKIGGVFYYLKYGSLPSYLLNIGSEEDLKKIIIEIDAIFSMNKADYDTVRFYIKKYSARDDFSLYQQSALQLTDGLFIIILLLHTLNDDNHQIEAIKSVYKLSLQERKALLNAKSGFYNDFEVEKLSLKKWIENGLPDKFWQQTQISLTDLERLKIVSFIAISDSIPLQYLSQKILDVKGKEMFLKEYFGISPTFELQAEKGEREENTVKTEQEIPEDTVIFVNNAGIVLAYPFLTHYFNSLGLLSPLKKFKSDQDAKRAVHLLQYLATKEEESPEYLMSLNKLLCGVSFEFVLDSKITLTDEEIRMSNELLEVMIERWPILKNTSPDGLRNSFFIRKGKISTKKKDWTLRVEQKSYDLLLDKLPWGISMIRLPWMKNILYVEWR